MTFNNWAYIYLGMGEEDPAVDRAVIERGGLRTTMVAVPDKSAAEAPDENETTRERGENGNAA